MSFDRLARHYRWMEWLLAGNALHQCRTAFLDEARHARSVLLVGEGHGRFLLELCRANPRASVCCLDASPCMNDVAKKRIIRHGIDPGRVEFVSLPVLQFTPDQSFDLIVTHFFLDCFGEAELQSVISKLTSFLAPKGRWIIADFQVPPSGWRKWRAQAVLALAYAFFSLCVGLPARRLVSPEPHLYANGLARQRRAVFHFSLLYAEIWTHS